MKLRKMKLALSYAMVVAPVFTQAAEPQVTAPRVVQALEATFGAYQESVAITSRGAARWANSPLPPRLPDIRAPHCFPAKPFR